MADTTAKTLRPAIVRDAGRKSWLTTDAAVVHEKIGKEVTGRRTFNDGMDE